MRSPLQDGPIGDASMQRGKSQDVYMSEKPARAIALDYLPPLLRYLMESGHRGQNRHDG